MDAKDGVGRSRMRRGPPYRPSERVNLTASRPGAWGCPSPSSCGRLQEPHQREISAAGPGVWGVPHSLLLWARLAAPDLSPGGGRRVLAQAERGYLPDANNP